MRKLKLVVSDFHIGCGETLADGRLNPLEDFHFDDKFVEFLDYHSRGDFAEADIELIINGDFFNHLQVDLEAEHAEIIDEREALSRTEAILKGHPLLVEGLRKFAGSPRRSVTFLLGNHDPGLLFASVHALLRRLLGERVRVLLNAHRFDGIHVEHGNQYFADNAYHTRRLFLSRKLPSPVVNLPWGSFFVIHILNKIKLERPYFDKIWPMKQYFRWALVHDTGFACRAIARIIFYFFWLRFRKDPHRRSSFGRTIRIIKEVPLSPKLHVEAKKLLLADRELKVVVFGHTHGPVIRQFAADKTYINTGVWNEQISMDIANPGRIVRLTYAHLEYDASGKVHPSLKEWKGSHKIIEEVTV